MIGPPFGVFKVIYMEMHFIMRALDENFSIQIFRKHAYEDLRD